MRRSLVMMLMAGSLGVTTGCYHARATMEVEDDPFKKVLVVNGPEADVPGQGGIFVGRSLYFIRTFIERDGSGIPVHQLYITMRYLGDWRFYERAVGPGGRSLPLSVIDRDVSSCDGSCNMTETLGVLLPPDVMDHEAEGYAIKISTRSGGHAVVIPLTAAQISEQVAAADSVGVRLAGSR